MKTTDLIPIILYQLRDGDKYGYEIVKQIEDSSNGSIIIKQPTLYSILKKLEQGRFISSYWQDSEIGGKRHYYKLTDNGKAQLDTYPPFDQLLKDALESEGIMANISANLSPTDNQQDVTENDNIEDSCIQLSTNESVAINNMDQIVDTEDIKPTSIDLSSSFADLNQNSFNSYSPFGEDQVIKPLTDNEDTNVLDTLINYQNTSIPTYNVEVEAENLNKDFQQDTNETSSISIFDAIDFASNSEQEDIETQKEDETVDAIIENEQQVVDLPHDTTYEVFTENVEPIAEIKVENKLYDKLIPNTDLINDVSNQIFNPDTFPTNQIEEIKFLNYIDFSNDNTTVMRRKAITKHIQKMSFTCISLLIAFIISIVVCSKYSFGKLYYISAIAVCIILILYPIILLKSIPKIRFKYCSKPFKYSISRDFFIKLSIFLSLIIIIFAYNLTIATSIKSIFAISNFANFISPIMFSLIIILDFGYSVMFYKQYTK